MTLATVALNCAKKLGRANAAGDAILDLEAEIKGEIAETIRFYNRQKFALTEFRGVELTTVAGTTWYSSVDLTNGDGDQDNTGRSAVDVKDITRITYMRDNTGTPEAISQVDYKRFESWFEGNAPNGGPNYFTMYAGQIGLWPTPDDAYTIYFSAHVKPAVPTADSDDSVWLTEAGEMIEAGALKRVCVNWLQDAERAQHFAAIEKSARDVLAMEYALKTSSGRVRVHE